MRIVDCICMSGNPSPGIGPHGRNEDWISFRNDSYALLMDGSTGLCGQIFPQTDIYHSAAQWFVHRFAQLIEEQIDPFIPLKTLVRRSMDTMRQEYERALSDSGMDLSFLTADRLRLMQPSASMSLLRKRDREIDLFSLGDLCILARTRDGAVHNFSSCDVHRLDQQVIDLLIRECGAQNIDTASGMALPVVQELLQKNRLLKNSGKENGYWILGFDHQALDHAVTAQWDSSSPHSHLDCMLICSDGFAALNDTYHAFDCAENDANRVFLSGCEQYSLSALYNKLRAIEKDDALCNTFPRFKPSDDAAAMLIHF